ncbi:MAG: hypothetical protein XE05_1638, partial [Thermotogales bacterium 46_20]
AKAAQVMDSSKSGAGKALSLMRSESINRS